MKMSRTIIVFAATLGMSSTVAIAGEITGNGKDIEVKGRSECAFSGFNDQDGDPRDPGWISQNYGQNVRIFGLDPSQFDPNADAEFVPIPGFACNPNRGRDLHL